MKKKYEKAIIKLLNHSSLPMDVEKIRIKCKIGNWNTALTHCLELQREEKIQGMKTSKSWVFWIPLIKQSEENQ